LILDRIEREYLGAWEYPPRGSLILDRIESDYNLDYANRANWTS